MSMKNRIMSKWKEFKQMIKSFKQSLKDSKRDPTKECALYKEQDCVFVDSPFCDFPYCSMNKEFNEPNILVYSQKEFDRFCDKLGLNDENVEKNKRYAFISIIGTKNVIDDYL